MRGVEWELILALVDLMLSVRIAVGRRVLQRMATGKVPKHLLEAFPRVQAVLREWA